MFPTENVILPEAFSSRRSDLIFCLRLSGVDGENVHLPEAFGCLCLERKYSHRHLDETHRQMAKERGEAMFFLVWMGHLFAFSSCPMRGAYAIRPYTYRPKDASQPTATPYIYTDMTLSFPPLAVRGRCPLSPTFFSCLATRKEGKRKSSPREGL